MNRRALKRTTQVAAAGLFALTLLGAAMAAPVSSVASHHHHHHDRQASSDQVVTPSGGTPGGLIGNLLFPHPGPYNGGYFGNGPYGGYMGW